MRIAPDTEIYDLLSRLTDDIRRSLDDSLVGLYVYGSLVTGDFDRLDEMHERFIVDHPAWEDRVEVAYVSVSALSGFKTETSDIAVVSPGEPFHVK